MSLSIGQLASAADVKVPTIRFYEQIGLLPEPSRADNDRRVYRPDAIHRLAFIRHARQLGFSVDAVRSLLELSDHPERPCDEANVLASQQLVAVDMKILQLEALRLELQRMVAATCSGKASDCRIIDALAAPSAADGYLPSPR